MMLRYIGRPALAAYLLAYTCTWVEAQTTQSPVGTRMDLDITNANSTVATRVRSFLNLANPCSCSILTSLAELTNTN